MSPPRAVGTLGATLMSVNGMIGAGIFALPALLHAATGDFAPWLFLIFGALYSSTVLVAARLATMFEDSGGPQLYVQTAFGRVLGFQTGWLLIIGAAAGRAATLYVLVSYLANFFPALTGPFARQMAVLVLLTGLCGVTLTGMRTAMGGIVLGTILKLAPIALVCMLAFMRGGIDVAFRSADVDGIGSVALLVYFAFSGTAVSTYSAGEIRDPRRAVPRSMLLSLALITAFYMLVQWAYIAAGAPASDGGDTPLAAAAGVVMGEVGVALLTVAAVFSIAANALTYFVGSPRVVYGMAERGLLPAGLASVSRRFGTPDKAIWLFTAIVAALSFSGTFALLANVLSIGAQLWTLLMLAAFVKLHMLRPGPPAIARTVGWGAVVLVAAGFSLYALAQAPLTALAILAVEVTIGLVLFGLASRAAGIHLPIAPIGR